MIIPFITHCKYVLSQIYFYFADNKKTTEYKDLRPICIAASRIKIYQETHNVLPEPQSGLESKHSGLTALSLLLHDILGAADNPKSIICVLLDYSKAFSVSTIVYILLTIVYRF